MVWLNDAFGGKFPIQWSLGIIGGIVAAAVLASLAVPRRGGPPAGASPAETHATGGEAARR
jgi:tellurite resistance protein TerC